MSAKRALDMVWARTPSGLVVPAWYPMKMAASKVESMPSIIMSGRGQDRTTVTSGGRSSSRRFCPLPWESLMRISVAPAARAPRIAASTSCVMYLRAVA
jgi:hypothetical protein